MGLNITGPACAGLKISALLLCAAMIIGCASGPAQTSTAMHGVAVDIGAYGYPGAAQVELARETASALGVPQAHFAAGEGSFSRVEIADSGLVRPAAHEAALDPASGGKIANLLSGPAGSPLLLAQNSMADNGWRKADVGYFHAFSGLICPYGINIVTKNEDEGTEEKLIVPLTGIRVFKPDGSDTACDYNTETGDVYYTFFVSKWPDVALADHFGAALKHMVDRFDVVSEQPVVVIDMKPEDAAKKSSIVGKTRAGGFLLAPQDGVSMKTSLWLNKTGDWHVKARATYRVEMDGDKPKLGGAEIIASIYHAITLYKVDEHINAEEPQGVEVSG